MCWSNCSVQSTCSTCYHPSYYVALSSLHAVHATTHHIMLHCPVYMQYMLPPITLCCTVQSKCSTCYHPSHYVALSSLHAVHATTHHIMLHCPVCLQYMLPPITLCCTVQYACSTCYHPSRYVATDITSVAAANRKLRNVQPAENNFFKHGKRH
jgi:hypothetical protein